MGSQTFTAGEHTYQGNETKAKQRRKKKQACILSDGKYGILFVVIGHIVKAGLF